MRALRDSLGEGLVDNFNVTDDNEKDKRSNKTAEWPKLRRDLRKEGNRNHGASHVG